MDTFVKICATWSSRLYWWPWATVMLLPWNGWQIPMWNEYFCENNVLPGSLACTMGDRHVVALKWLTNSDMKRTAQSDRGRLLCCCPEVVDKFWYKKNCLVKTSMPGSLTCSDDHGRLPCCCPEMVDKFLCEMNTFVKTVRCLVLSLVLTTMGDRHVAALKQQRNLTTKWTH